MTKFLAKTIMHQTQQLSSPEQQKYTCLLAGAVGAGKSTVLKNIDPELNFGIIPEFIDAMEDGKKKLQERLSGDLSNKDFQIYILESYEYLCTKFSNFPRRIIERSPVEGAEIFSLTEDFHDLILERAEELHKKHDIPDPRDLGTLAVVDANFPTENVIADVHKIINDDLRNGVKHRTIYLRISPETSFDRVKSRSQESDEGYYFEYLKRICDKYDNFFQIKQ